MNKIYPRFLTNLLIAILLTTAVFEVQGQRKLPRNISRANSVEYAPSISADGSTMVYQTDLYQLGSRFNLYWTFKNPDGWWDNPKEIRSINTYGDKNDLIGGPVISYDGNTIYFFANFAGGKGAEDIYYAKRVGDEFSKPINIGSAINTSGYEGFPSISPDGSILYFVRAAEEQTIDGVFCYNIWASERDQEGNWQKAYKLPAPINQGCDKNPRIMTDNEMLVFASIREESLGEGKFDLFYSRKDKNDNWGVVKPLSGVNTFNDEIFAAISSCGDEMYIIAPTKGTQASNGDLTFENLDIYQTTLLTDDKPKPVSLVQGRMLDDESGKAISGEIEIIKNENLDNPGIIYSNKNGRFTLILTKGNKYSVNFKVPGYTAKKVIYDMTELGGCTTQKSDVRIERYRHPFLLTVVNSRTGELIDAKASITEAGNPMTFDPVSPGTFKTTLNARKSYKIQLSDSSVIDTTFTYRPKVNRGEEKELRDTVRLRPLPPQLHVRVINKETKQPVPNAVLLIMNAQERSTLYRGLVKEDQVAVDLNYKNTFVVFGVANNHFSAREVLDMSKSEEEGIIQMDIELVELKPGAKLVVNNITFATNSAELTKSSYAEIDQVITVLKRDKHIKIEIAAHTDDVGSDENNLVLSNARAKSVLDYMQSKGIDLSRLISKGYGESDPAVPNTSAANRALNRRVEFRIPKN